MKSFNHQEIVDVETELKVGFAEFIKLNPEPQGRKYPQELKNLVFQAKEKGLRSAAICRLTGLSSSAVHRYTKPKDSVPIGPRRLTIVGTKAEEKLSAPIVIRLSSGVAIELNEAQDLSLELLKRLASMGTSEVRDVATR